MELWRALAAYLEEPSPALASALELPRSSRAEQTELFGFQLYPYASVYLGPEGMLGGEARARVAGFWRATGLTPPPEPDHLAALLGLYAGCAEVAGERGRHLRHALLWEHLLSWLPAWLARLDELAPPGYRAWGGLLRSALLAEAAELGPPAALPLHLRLAGPVAGWETLLVAVRSGVLLARADLARAARELGLGLRQGERRYALDHLAAQAPDPVRAWLGAEAARQAELYAALPAAWQPVAGHWAARARATAGDLAAAHSRA